MSDQSSEIFSSDGQRGIDNRPLYREVTSKGLKKKYPDPLTLSENPLTVHYLDIAENMFGGIFKDPDLDLECNWILDIRPQLNQLACYPKFKRLGVPVLVGEFLSLNMGRLNQIAKGDEILHNVLLILYHLRMLEKLILFCQAKGARTLMFVFKENYCKYLEIYRPSIVYEKDVRTCKGTETHAAVAVSARTNDCIIENLYHLEQRFRQHLWRYQKNNPTFRQYLKNQSLVGL